MATLLFGAPALAQLGVGAAPRPDGSILPPGGPPAVAQSVPVGPQDIVFGPGNDDHLIARPPNLQNVPPIPMSAPRPTTGRASDSVIVHDSTNNQTWEVPALPGNGQAGGEGGGYTGADGFVVPPEMARNFGSMTNACCLTSFPASANVRLLMRFVDSANTSFYYVCSGAMQDAGMVMCAAHCVFWNNVNGVIPGTGIPGNGGWAAEIWVYPGWDGNGASPPSGTVQNFGFSHATAFGAGSDYVNTGNFDADFGIVMAGHGGERHVGMLTGWYGWAWGFDCATIQSRTYYNYSFPAENSGCCPAGHDGATMQFWGGQWDACPSNQLQLFTSCGCNTAVWGGMSGSNAYYIDGSGNRLAHAVCSTSNRSTLGQYCKMWQGWSDFMEGQRANVRGATFDLEAFRYRLTGSTVIQATTNTPTANFLASNISNADPGNASFTYRVYLSTNDTISASDTLLGTFSYTFDYAPMQNVNIGVPVVTIPNVAPGTYWLGAILDSGSDSFSGNNDTSLWDAQQITVTAANPNAPANNLCANATAYTIGSTVSGTTLNATNDGTATCGSSTTSPDVWYSFYVPTCGTIHFDTCGSGYDTVISLHTGCPGTTANQVACNDDNDNGGNNACGGGLQSGFDVSLTPGSTYLLRISGFNGSSGNYLLHSYYILPANDDCSNATPYTAGTTITGCMGPATNDGFADCGASGTSGDVWFTLVPPSTGTLRINTCGSAFDTVLSVHTGCPGTTANEIACDDDSAAGPCTGTLQSDVDVAVIAGNTYYIRLAAYAGHVGTGNYTLSSGYIVPPNNLCSGVIPISIGSSVTGTTVSAGIEGASTCGGASAPDVWYSMTSSCTGTVRVSLCGSNYDTMLSIHSACPGTTANQLFCDDDSGSASDCPGTLQSSLDFTAVSGTTYYIRVAGFSTNSGYFHLSTRYLTTGSDFCGNAPTVTDGSYPFCNCGTNTDGPSEVCGIPNNDLWFHYVPAYCGTVTATTCGSPGFDTVLAAYNGEGGCPTENNTALACNDDASCTPNGLESRITFPVAAGHDYYIRLGGFSTNRGNGVLQISSTGSACGSADFNCDGDIGTDSDIASFFACLSGNCPPAPCCSSADFNGDGDIGTDADIAAFFRVLGGGSC